ncbi:unnamed protein product [Psylliodes chrysocephalus]|uniref:CHK kinase-like domain-containing protein n=1 Tax=Psylliodes chrysocephalus TaxID=3402493 RepID=A0A9P0CTX5_9CUCU|nr:unnamed protein product [Psylliodes chrysocephala]
MSVEGIDSILSKNVLKGKKVLNVEVTNLVQPGENFGGELLKLNITTEDEETKSQDVLHAVAKKIPVAEFAQEMFNVQRTFKGEISFYEKLVPAFQEFQKEHNLKDIINCFGTCYGGRLNMNGSDTVDRDALILMENLKYLGYSNIDRYIGYNLEEAHVLLKDLAALHAIPLAIKLRKPEFFQKEIRPFLNNQFIHEDNNAFGDTNLLLLDILCESDKCGPFISRVRKVLNAYKHPQKYQAREPFATFYHGDLWVNNAMMKYENGKPVSNKFIDFQCYDYRSPASDLLNFLITSVNTDVLKEEIDGLLKFYHSEFLDNLRKLECDIEPFNWFKFQEELKEDAQRIFAWATFFVNFVVFGPKGAHEHKQEANFNFDNIAHRDTIRKSIMLEAKERLYFIVQYYARKNWL